MNNTVDFHGVKVAILVDDQLLLHLRDNKPGLFNANMWDFPGGGREGSESPQECAVREVEEELCVKLNASAFIWEKVYPAQKDPSQKAYFMVATMSRDSVADIDLQEGQRWKLFSQEEFFKREDVIEALKERFKDYLESKKL